MDENINLIYANREYEGEVLELVRQALQKQEISDELEQYHDNDIAAILPELTYEERQSLYALFGVERFSDIFAYVEDPEDYIAEMGVETAADILENMDSDDAVDILDEVDDETEEKIVELMDEESREDVKLIRSYDEDEIGSRMTNNYISIPSNLSVKGAMHELVAQAGDNDNISRIYVTVPGTEKYCGAIELKDLIIAREGTELSELINTAYPCVNDCASVEASIEELRDYAEDSFPIVDENGDLLGIITAQDLVEAVDDEMGDDYAKLGGLSEEEDLSESVFVSMKKRLPWLIVLLFLGIGVSTVVGLFEGVVRELALVICFQSLILDMAGNVGTQSLAVTIRVLMDENLSTRERIGLIFKEFRVGAMNGLCLGLISFTFVGLYIVFAKGYLGNVGSAFAISGCVGFSLLCAMIISSLVGTVVPMVFKKLKIDPAVASGPLITTVNDLVSVVVYYGLAWALLINVLHIS